MSRTYRDGKGPRIAGEIGRLSAIKGDRVVLAFGFDLVGSPIRKKSAKKSAGRLRRVVDKKIIANDVKE